MPVPANRAKIRLVRGTYSNIAANISELVDGELCYARDQNKLYIVNDDELTAVSTASSGGGESIDPATLLETIQDAIGDSLIAGTNVTITYNDSTGKTTINSTATGGGSGGATNLDGLTDVTIDNLSNSQLLRYDSTTQQWKNVTPNYLTSVSASNLANISINALSDVNTVSPAPQNGDVLTWSGTSWVSQPIETGSITFAGLSDVQVTNPQAGESLAYDSFSGKWVNVVPTPPTETDTLDSVTSRGSATANDITVGRAYFKNTFTSTSLLPSASSNNGLFVQVTNTGKAYYASSSNWVELHSGTHALNDLSDVEIAGSVTNKSPLLYNSGTGLWAPGGLSIDNLIDVDTTTSTPTNGSALIYNSSTGQWGPGIVSGGTGIPEAPTDGQYYIRQNGAWVTLQGALSTIGIDAGTASESGTGGSTSFGTGTSSGSTGSTSTGIPEPPSDGNFYLRQSASWVTLQSALATIGIDAGQAT